MSCQPGGAGSAVPCRHRSASNPRCSSQSAGPWGSHPLSPDRLTPSLKLRGSRGCSRGCSRFSWVLEATPSLLQASEIRGRKSSPGPQDVSPPGAPQPAAQHLGAELLLGALAGVQVLHQEDEDEQVGRADGAGVAAAEQQMEGSGGVVSRPGGVGGAGAGRTWSRRPAAWCAPAGRHGPPRPRRARGWR